MKTYRIRLTKDVEKSILKINRSLPAIGEKIKEQIEALKSNPNLGSKLQGADQETRRIRVGDYRIIYEVYEQYVLILVVYIGPRGGAYSMIPLPLLISPWAGLFSERNSAVLSDGGIMIRQKKR
jgi:mRNA interferase RelE/StbE